LQQFQFSALADPWLSSIAGVVDLKKNPSDMTGIHKRSCFQLQCKELQDATRIIGSLALFM
jgi:hypothetical protein